MPSSYWKICYPGPTGEQICTELYAELPPELEGYLKDELKMLAGIEELASQVPDQRLRIRLVEALDDAAVRLNARLEPGFGLRRMDEGGLPEFDGVPLVVGMTDVEGFNTLRAAGYQVKTVWEWTSSSEEHMITDQSPRAGAPNLPPALVHIWVRTLPPDPPPSTEPATPLPA